MDAPPKKRKTRKRGGKGSQLIRSFFTFLLVIGLIGFSLYSQWQILELKQQNSDLTASNQLLKRELQRHKGIKQKKDLKLASTPPFDPVADAQIHLGEADAAIQKGNIGDAVSECQVAGKDIQLASSSTSSNVRNSVAALKDKLGSIQQQTNNLWHKLGV